jgi:uncharacterized protein (DUF169 family)
MSLISPINQIFPIANKENNKQAPCHEEHNSTCDICGAVDIARRRIVAGNAGRCCGGRRRVGFIDAPVRLHLVG